MEDEIDTSRINDLCIQYGIGECAPALLIKLKRIAYSAKSLHALDHELRTVVRECRREYMAESLDVRLHAPVARIMWELIGCQDPKCGPECRLMKGFPFLQRTMDQHQEEGHDVPVHDAGVEERTAGEIPRAPSSNPFDREFRQSFQDQLEEVRKDANHDRFTILWVLFALFLLSFGFATTRIVVFVIVAGLAFRGVNRTQDEGHDKSY